MVEQWELERMGRQTLVRNYEHSVLDLIKEFIKVYFDDDTWTDNDIIESAVGCEADGIVNINDYYIGFNEMVYCLRFEVSEKEFFKWYDYTLEWNEFKHYISLDAWVRGAPRRSSEELEKFKELQRKVNESKQLLEEEIKKANFIPKDKI